MAKVLKCDRCGKIFTDVRSAFRVFRSGLTKEMTPARFVLPYWLDLIHEVEREGDNG